MKLSKLASAAPFAHLLGLSPNAAKAEDEEDKDKQAKGESDDDYAKRMEEKEKDDEARRAEDEREKEDARKAEEEKDKEDAKRAEEDDGDESMEDEKDDKENGKRAGRAKGARQRERIRCARIVAAGVKAGRINQACVFAFDTQLSASQAIAALNASSLDAAPRAAGLRERMSAVQTPNVGTDSGAAASAPSLASRIIAAGKKRRGEA